MSSSIITDSANLVSGVFGTTKDIATNVTTSISHAGTSLIVDFFSFLTQKNILDIAIAFVIGNYVNDFANNFITIIAQPIISKIAGKEEQQLQEFSVKLFGIIFNIGTLIYLLLKLIIIIFILYLFFKVIPQKVTSAEQYVKNSINYH